MPRPEPGISPPAAPVTTILGHWVSMFSGNVKSWQPGSVDVITVGAGCATALPHSAVTATTQARTTARAARDSWTMALNAKRAPCNRAGRSARVRCALAALPHGIALLLEGRRALLGVVRREHRTGELALLLPLLGGGPVELLLDDLLGRREGERGVLGDLGREGERLVHRLPGRGEAVDHAERVEALGRPWVAGQ